MGQTLTNGIYLPAEGERNCYEGLAANWTALDGLIGGYNAHIGNTTIHVTAADKQAWNGKADNSALTAHTGDTTIHVTAEDKAKWDAVTGKADDSGVVHNTGNETVAGIKSFSDDTFVKSLNNTKEVTSPSASSTVVLPIVATVTYTDQSPSQYVRLNLRITADGVKSFFPHDNNVSLGLSTRVWSDFFAFHGYFHGQQQGDEYSSNARTNLTLLANRDTSGQSCCVVDTFRENTSQGTGGHILGFGIKENSVRYEGCRFSWSYDDENSGYVFALRPTTQGTNQPIKYELGTSLAKWSTFNGLNPSSLGMPDLNNGIDISGYITHLDKVVNNYTPPANGWLSIRVKKTSLVHASLMIYQTGGLLSSCETDELGISGTNLPVIANRNVEIYIYADVLASAKFYPCQGNI